MSGLEDRWWDPHKLLEAAHAIRKATPSDEFFCDPAFKKVREGIAAADFAGRRPWNKDWQVYPVSDYESFPDFKLRSDQHERLFELVEADSNDRRRCEEYRAARNGPATLEFYDPVGEADQALEEIRRVVSRKAEKNYKPKPNLLVYVNLSQGEPTANYAAGLSDQFSNHFESAWLLWGSSTFRLWPNPARIRKPSRFS
jgi:hypothetical protein